MRFRDELQLPLAAILASGLSVFACSPSSGSSIGIGGLGNGNGGGNGAGDASGSSGAGPQGTGGDGFGNGSGGDMPFDPGMVVVNNGPDASCAGAAKKAERETITTQVPVQVTQPVALYIMLDQSGSMAEPATTGSKWSTLVSGFTSFVNDPKSAGIDVALNFFPPIFGDSGSCDGTGYDKPRVPMAPLPQNAAPIVAAFGPSPTGLGTPTEGGLRGAENYCEAYQKANPAEKCVVVFATDGQPSSCDTTTSDLVQIVTDAKTAGITTFAIGMAGATAGEVNFPFLDAIAVAGGTNCNPPATGNEACNIGGGSDLTTALNTIRTTVTQYVTKTEVRTATLACDFSIPDAPAGQVFDRDKVNVVYTDTSNQNQPVLEAASLADCATTNSNAWYYDNPTTPTKILLCPKTCSAINAGTGDGGVLPASAAGTAPAVNVVFGCATIVAPPA